ncbi:MULTISPECIES: TetR/AcrR family transcriptional regulator [Thermomonospora]|uniref:Transcriptional regulator, TetR family n=1 Tax=Thermomonospora curvata (strain ATCC 19995 / DSM 43183 / JCM 3096 / KCTC 9072 / NBRC 15933 / NCIMB 10081 / Henssen B9) TaxID=471852 RepID=D1AD55_THECD|nr:MULTISPECIES: TetR/AcrR family transcriptional regulator [Thermomonospora]ACY99364.1 transcriptional regulator, TetR family [Thermomonospora curvata DSM 43183]PKK12413.1 MAG: TetR/AcrR family transcriptional regulator [Thermomonospora sp. CIF 1]
MGTNGHEGGSGRQWARADATRQALLQAAQEVFADRGYHDAGIAEIVERSGISVGSLYHHYGGKAGLFMALWEHYNRAQEEGATRAVAQARKRGEKDPIALFIAGARAYLRVCWEQRDVAHLFHEGEGPSGFALMRRSRARQWVAQNTKLLRGLNGDGEERGGRRRQVLSLVLTTVIGEAGREIATAESEEAANEIVEEVCRILIRLAGGSAD